MKINTFSPLFNVKLVDITNFIFEEKYWKYMILNIIIIVVYPLSSPPESWNSCRITILKKYTYIYLLHIINHYAVQLGNTRDTGLFYTSLQ